MFLSAQTMPQRSFSSLTFSGSGSGIPPTLFRAEEMSFEIKFCVSPAESGYTGTRFGSAAPSVTFSTTGDESVSRPYSSASFPKNLYSCPF